MNKCLFTRDGLMERIEDAPEIRKIGEQIQAIKSLLLPTLTDQQRELFRQFDDAVISEGTVRVQSTIRAACGCSECKREENKP